MTAADLVKQLKSLGADSYRKILLKHGAAEPLLGVKISEMQKIRKRVGKDYPLAMELYETGIYDAQYLAGMIADETKMTPKDLKRWLRTRNSGLICGTVVAWVAAESAHGMDLALEWIESKNADDAQTGWQTLAMRVSIKDDAELDLGELKGLLDRVAKSIHRQPDAVRYAMNTFVIALGSYVRDLAGAALETGKRMGKVSVDMGETACKVPYAPDYIKKAQGRGSLKKKRATARC